MSICLKLFIFVVLLVVTGHSLPTLSEKQCKDYLASNDINQQIQALFLCPEKWRQKAQLCWKLIWKKSSKESLAMKILILSILICYLLLMYSNDVVTRPLDSSKCDKYNKKDVVLKLFLIYRDLGVKQGLICAEAEFTKAGR
ncbi:unnamed protein product [Adineta ricciae]|uniref:Uncharacterized protein n=1 Tax=Adineta ricciae TaxID=249248 RepID=A0A813NIC4_ADIRI|nr:unnamed protein product [Adineta ricciae]